MSIAEAAAADGLAAGHQGGATLKAIGISMRFGGVKALDQVDFTLQPGTWLGLIGPNGSGKTTLLNVLSGIYLPVEGTITVNNLDLTSSGVRRRALAGVVRTFQQPQLAPTLTIFENVLLGGDLRRKRNHLTGKEAGLLDVESRDLLSLLRCTDYADHLPGSVPYGVQKKVELARALLAKPEVLLLDEPAAGLSREERSELVDLLSRLHKTAPRTAVCVVEHDIRLVAATCPIIQVLNFGRTLTTGPANLVLNDPTVREAYLGRSGKFDRQMGKTDA